MRLPLVVLLLLAPLVSCSASHPQPRSERLVYRVVDSSGVVTSSTIDVSPPYRARVVDRDASGAVTGGFAWDGRGLYSFAPGGAATETALVAPGFPGPLSGLAVALPVALTQRLVSVVGTSSVLGRPCTTWLSEQPLDGAPIAAAHGGDHTRSCVDGGGRILSEQWDVDGQLVRTRIATSVGAGPSLQGAVLFLSSTPTPLPTDQSDYVVHASTAKELARLLQVPVPLAPGGLAPDTATVVLDKDPSRSGYTREAAVLTWTGGGRLVVLRIERDLSGTSKGTVRGAPVDLGALGTGHLEPVLSGLRVVVDEARGLRAIATADLPADRLLAWIRTLRLQTGP